MMSVRPHRLALGFAAVLVASPAAAIPDGSTAKVRIGSTPAGAVATSEDGQSCRTPCTLRLPLDSGGRIQVAKEGYETQTVRIGSHVDGEIVARDVASSARDPFAAAVNALALAVWGSASYKSLDARRINVQLVPVFQQGGDSAGSQSAALAPSVAAGPASGRAAYGPARPD